MRPGFLRLFALPLLLLAACSKGEDEKPCNTIAAGTGLRFRVTDTSGKDYLYRNNAGPGITQPCRTAPVTTVFTKYGIPNTSDTGVLISFDDIRTPVHGEGGECFRIFFNWDGGDIDTVDWHYRIDESDGCVRHTIDYLTFNGKQAEKKYDNRYDFYRLVKK